MTVRWGIVGPGAIAVGFANAMSEVHGGRIVAVASRSRERADAFADRYDIGARYDDDAALAADPNVDVVYVATPQSRHAQDTIRLLEAGKHVLCEKPFALNADQALKMVETARSIGLFLMDAIWTRFLPSYRALVDVLDHGRIGEPLLVEADFSMRLPAVDPAHRLFDPHRGGGGLLDLGIYPLQLASLVLGAPEHVVADGRVGETGVDEWVAAVLRHPGGKLGVIKAGIRVGTSCTARVSGSEGWIDIPAFMHCPEWITVTTSEGPERIEAPPLGNGMRFEIMEVHRCLAEGLTESPTVPLDETVALMTTLDEIRTQIGLVFPNEDG